MSIQRAVVSCQRCYDRTTRENGRRGDMVYLRGITYRFRNDAMVSLEGVFTEMEFHPNYKELCNVAITGLDRCRDCDYSEPKIVNLADKV